MRRLLVSCALAVALLPGHGIAESLDVAVNRAIERGVASLRPFLDADGAGTTRHHATYPEGDTALLVYTLLESGVLADDPQIRKSIEWLRYRKIEKTYSASVYVLALDALRDREVHAAIQSTARWIEAQLERASKRWAYPGGESDLSNTQYAALALWTAERSGYRAKPETWAAAALGVADLQAPSGGFCYRSGWAESGAMTAGALAVLEMAMQRLPESERRFHYERKTARTACDRGWAFLERNFAVDGNPHGRHGRSKEWSCYYLYGLERLGAITKRDRFAGRDWYAEGAAQLLAWQREDGSWGDPWDTCFAVLFLRRATLTPTEGAARAGSAAEMATAAAAPVAPDTAVRWVRRWLVLGPIPNPDDELFEDPPFREAELAPVAGAAQGPWKWTPVASRTKWVHLGPSDRPTDRSVGWGFTYLHATAPVDAVLWVGHDDGAAVMVDGAVLYSHHFHDRDDLDTHAIRVHLDAGVHRVLVKVENWVGDHAFAMRITRSDGGACTELTPSLTPDASDTVLSARAQPGLFSLEALRTLLPASKPRTLTFASGTQLEQLAFEGDYMEYPRWAGEVKDAGDGRPSPGAKGMLGMHAESSQTPLSAYWRVDVPTEPVRLLVRASSGMADPGACDALLRISVFDGELRELVATAVGPYPAPAPKNWRWIEADLSPWSGKSVVVIFSAADGGTRSWYHEDLWIDEIEIRR